MFDFLLGMVVGAYIVYYTNEQRRRSRITYRLNVQRVTHK